MAKRRNFQRLRRLLKLMYHEARTYRRPRTRPTGVPGPAFDVLVVATFLLLCVILLL